MLNIICLHKIEKGGLLEEQGMFLMIVADESFKPAFASNETVTEIRPEDEFQLFSKIIRITVSIKDHTVFRFRA